jgi:hypothetical protein
MMADSKQTLACAMLSVALFIGLILNYLVGIWQADPIIGLLTITFLIKEGYQTLKENKLCSCAAYGGLTTSPKGRGWTIRPIRINDGLVDQTCANY